MPSISAEHGALSIGFARNDRTERYASTALERELAELATTGHGRNNGLNKASRALGQLVGAGVLEESEVKARLYEAAMANGYVAKDGPAATRATIASGFAAGLKTPRQIPNGQEPRMADAAQKPAAKLSGVPVPDWTSPDAEGRPTFQAIGRDQPGNVRDEVPGRRHAYRRDGENVRFKIKRTSGTAYLNFYRVRRPSDGLVGWQALKPAGFVPVPYTGPLEASDPFAAGSTFEMLHWPEGERDVDTLWRLGLQAFTFGGASDVPECSDLLRGRDVVILADNDDDGEKCLARKVAMALPVASRVRVVRFSDLPVGGDVTLWMEEHGGSPAGLIARARPVTKASTSDVEWKLPKTIPSGLAPVDTFSPKMIPEALGPWVEDIADRMQCPSDYVGVAAVVALSAALGRRIAIRPQERTNWEEVGNLWGMVVGSPGAMKSPAMSAAMAPLHRLEAKAREQNTKDQAKHAKTAEVARIRREEAQKAFRKALKSGDADASEMLDIEVPDAPAPRRFIAIDTTYDALGTLLASNPNGILAFRDELISLLRTLDREEQAAARGFYLSAWNGTGDYTFDRIVRGITHIDAACLSMLHSTQPGRLAEYISRAVSGGSGDDGLIQRFGLLVWPDGDGDWHNVDRYPVTAAGDRAWDTFRRLSEVEPGTIGAMQGEFDKIPFLRLDTATQGLFLDWRADLEGRLRGDALHGALKSHLSKYRKLVPSLALLNHVADDGTGPVSETALARAIAFSIYLESHARRAYGSGRQIEVDAGKAILARIRKGDLGDGFTVRDILQKDWSNLSNKDQVAAGLELLDDLDWLQSQELKTGGRPKTTFRINPRGLT